MKNNELQKEVEILIAEVENTHRYSMSRIYKAYNEAFGRDEKPQACASCLIRKVRDLKRWLSEQVQETETKKQKKTKPASTTGPKVRKVRNKADKEA